MRLDGVSEAPGEAVDDLLELWVLERVEAAAAVADRVVVVLAARVGGLVARRAVHIDAVDQLQARENVQSAIDAREADGRAALAQTVVDVLGAQAAVLAGEQGEDLLARTAGPVPGAGQLSMGVIPPSRGHEPDGSAKR